MIPALSEVAMTELPFLDKEISWLSFNHRVLQEAQDPRVPLLERLRFLGIYSNNMDEFYRVRVADIRRRVILSQTAQQKKDALTLMDTIQNKVLELQDWFEETYTELLSRLSECKINLINEIQLSPFHRLWLDQYYNEKLRRHIFPIIINDKLKLATLLNDESTYLMISMGKDKQYQYALIEVPSSEVPRFIQLPNEHPSGETSIILLDNVIRYSMESIFRGFFDFDYIHAYSMKLTRDAEFDVNNEISQSLYEQMSSGLRKRLNAAPVRLVYDKKMPQHMLDILRTSLDLNTNRGLIAGGRYHSFKDFIKFPNPGNPALEYEVYPALLAPNFDYYRNAFDAITDRDILLYYPYHRFSYFTEWLRQSAYDPKVKKIEICLYRVAKRSRVVSALIEAVKNGKEVLVNIELRARFDEEYNMMWADKMSNAGVKVSFGIPNLKVHSKICLITRQEDDQEVLYGHVGTGNFNESNAKIYTDFSLYTRDPRITKEVAKVFEFLKHPYLKYKFKHLLVSPLNCRKSLEAMIDIEIDAALRGRPNGIVLKVNNLVDLGLLQKLYQANNAGVKIRLIVRGICSLVPGVPGFSEHIVITSIIDRYLEHPRVAIFGGGDQRKVYISSADWMERNIDGRVEVGTPIFCARVKKQIIDIIDIQLADTDKARLIEKELNNPYQIQLSDVKVRSQLKIYEYLVDENLQQESRLLAEGRTSAKATHMINRQALAEANALELPDVSEDKEIPVVPNQTIALTG